MKKLAGLFLSFSVVVAHAAPTLYADPYLTDPPDLASMQVNGGSPISCMVVPVSGGGVQPQCDLAGLSTTGTYSIVMSVARNGDAALGLAPGVSGVFSYTVQLGSVATPIPTVSGGFLVSNLYSTGTIDAANMIINNGAPIACPLVAVTGGVQARCSLASITTTGTYTLVMTVAKAQTITNVVNISAVRTLAGVASSAPFSYLYKRSVVAPTNLGVAP